MSDLVIFLNARLDEDEADAKARRGTFPSPGVTASGAVWLHIQYGGNAVVTHYWHPVEGYGDMAALRNWADTESGWTDERVLREIAAKRAILDLHTPGHPSCNVCHAGGWDWEPEQSPCPTVRQIASVYSDHRDYDEAWKP